MKTLRRNLRVCLVFNIIVLTFFNGSLARGCVCPDGHLKLFCGGTTCCAHAKHQPKFSNRDVDCCCSNQCETEKDCCHGRSGAQGLDSATRDCCQPLQLSPIVATKLLPPSFDAQFAAFDSPIAYSFYSIGLEHRSQNYEVDVGPPRALLSVLQHFLI